MFWVSYLRNSSKAYANVNFIDIDTYKNKKADKNKSNLVAINLKDT